MHGLTRYLLSGAVVLIAVGALAVKYWDYLSMANFYSSGYR